MLAENALALAANLHEGSIAPDTGARSKLEGGWAMKTWVVGISLALAAIHSPTAAQSDSGSPTQAAPVVVEYYYRLKWGSLDEFKQLYAKNHTPLLEAVRQEGLIREIVMEEPFTHMAGGERWDFRVTITYPDAASAISSPQMETSWNKAWDSIYGKDDPEGARFMAEETKRFSLVEEHWDVIVQIAR